MVGGPQGDTGLTGRKIIVDSYGGMGRHGGGAFSGKDPSKVDRSARLHGPLCGQEHRGGGTGFQRGDPICVCDRLSRPGIGLRQHLWYRRQFTDEEIERAVCEVFSFKPAHIIKQLNLLRPIYSKTTNYGHFGKSDPDITWEKTDKIEALRRAASKPAAVAAATLRKAATLVNGRSGAGATVRPQVSP